MIARDCDLGTSHNVQAKLFQYRNRLFCRFGASSIHEIFSRSMKIFLCKIVHYLTPKPCIKEAPSKLSVLVLPRVLAAVLVDPQLRMNHRCLRILRHYDRDMSGPRDHWVGAILWALASVARMRVGISHDRKTAFSTNCPKLRECITMQNADAGAVCFRV